MPVYFHSEDISFTFKGKLRHKQWISSIIKREGKDPGNINIIFVSNNYLLSFNQKYLNHNYYTDVITFNNNEKNSVSGDIYISIDQVVKNSIELEVTMENELSRVIIHGVLHLLGYEDHTKEEKEIMRKEEDIALLLLDQL